MFPTTTDHSSDHHQLILEHHDGAYYAFCSCGSWSHEPITVSVCRLRDIYPRLEAEHQLHFEKCLAADFLALG
jgi:hypothetical protein